MHAWCRLFSLALLLLQVTLAPDQPRLCSAFDRSPSSSVVKTARTGRTSPFPFLHLSFCSPHPPLHFFL